MRAISSRAPHAPERVKEQSWESFTGEKVPAATRREGER